MSESSSLRSSEVVESLMGLVIKIETDDQNLDNNGNSQRNAYFYMLSIVLVLGIC